MCFYLEDVKEILVILPSPSLTWIINYENDTVYEVLYNCMNLMQSNIVDGGGGGVTQSTDVDTQIVNFGTL